MLLQILLNSSFPRQFSRCQQESSLTREFSRRSIRLVTELFFSPVNSAMMREPRTERAAFLHSALNTQEGMEFSLTEQRPTRVRWQILAILSLIMVVTAFGRLNLGIAGKSIQEEFQLSSQAMGWIFGAFAFGYALFQVPSGWAADRFGPRKTLTLAILWWATLTMVMNLVPYFALRLSFSLAWTFGVVRFLTGLEEAASYPKANRMVAFWTAKRERAIGSSLLLGGVGAGGVMAPALFAISMQRWGWQSSFFVSGILAIIVALVWFTFSTDRPA